MKRIVNRWVVDSKSDESFTNSHVLVKREQELHESWQARVCMRVSSTLMSWSNENMRVDKREFAWEFHQLSCPGQTRTRVARELTSESLHESFINSHVLVKREQELHESWQARICMRVSSSLLPQWSYNPHSNAHVLTCSDSCPYSRTTTCPQSTMAKKSRAKRQRIPSVLGWSHMQTSCGCSPPLPCWKTIHLTRPSLSPTKLRHRLNLAGSRQAIVVLTWSRTWTRRSMTC